MRRLPYWEAINTRATRRDHCALHYFCNPWGSLGSNEEGGAYLSGRQSAHWEAAPRMWDHCVLVTSTAAYTLLGGSQHSIGD